MAQRQSVGLGIEKFLVRNSLEPTGYSHWQGHYSALLGGPVRKNAYLEFARGRKLKSKQYSALSSGRFAASKSQGFGRCAPAATRFIAFAPQLSNPRTDENVGKIAFDAK